MKYDTRLEGLSDKIRMGIPVDFKEALEAIDYQEKLREEREKKLWFRIKKWFMSWIQ